jgi:hypothetical protein
MDRYYYRGYEVEVVHPSLFDKWDDGGYKVNGQFAATRAKAELIIDQQIKDNEFDRDWANRHNPCYHRW